MRHLFVIVACVLSFGTPAIAAPGCEALAAEAATRHGLPGGLLRAIARTESGRSVGGQAIAWPWTSNVRGKGYYYESREAALAHLGALVAAGERHFDVGCMQLNYRWHGENFADLAQMIDPAQNTDYAARYLSELRRETGDWDMATRYYHSRDAGRGTAYLGRVQRVMARLGPRAPQSSMPFGAAASAPAATSGPAPDRRFFKGAALIELASSAPASQSYWTPAALPEGALPRMP
ncbi:transglycosylase SLT domain-containing protein [Roseovarius aquimarinus]|uniref:Transglycosylase SLT domain-containing protein n=1 Tax=Roseovarius aquimarinus TaxID=1229156 RepID=A0ABW7I587_9RHOB